MRPFSTHLSRISKHVVTFYCKALPQRIYRADTALFANDKTRSLIKSFSVLCEECISKIVLDILNTSFQQKKKEKEKSFGLVKV